MNLFIMSTCPICCEAVNKSTRKDVSCFCGFSACRQCVEKYLLDISTDPHCMSCRKEWNREVLDINFTKKFVKQDLKKRREQVLLDRERSMMPATQVYIERMRQQEAIKVDMTDVKKKIRELQIILYNLQNRYYRALNGQYEVGAVESSKREFVRACPMTGCKGFLSTQWKCGVCDTWTCPECHEPKGLQKDSEHQCHPDNLATAKLLTKDSQPCPKCGAMCTKVDGCDQVFAMCCGTTFNWRTGRIDTGPIHAPDYYRWLQQNGQIVPRNPLDVPCGGLPYALTVRTTINKYVIDGNEKDKILRVYRLITHITNVEQNRYDIGERGEVQNRDIRIQYMTNKIDENSFKSILQQREKSRAKKREIYLVLSTVALAGTDIFQRVCAAKKESDVLDIVIEMNNLQRYTNESMLKISNRYSCVTPRIDGDWQTIRYYKLENS